MRSGTSLTSIDSTLNQGVCCTYRIILALVFINLKLINTKFLLYVAINFLGFIALINYIKDFFNDIFFLSMITVFIYFIFLCIFSITFNILYYLFINYDNPIQDEKFRESIFNLIMHMCNSSAIAAVFIFHLFLIFSKFQEFYSFTNQNVSTISILACMALCYFLLKGVVRNGYVNFFIKIKETFQN